MHTVVLFLRTGFLPLTIESDVSCGFFTYNLYYVEIVFLYSWFVECFSMYVLRKKVQLGVLREFLTWERENSRVIGRIIYYCQYIDGRLQ